MTQEQILGDKLIATWMGYKTWVTDTGIVMAEDDLTYAGHLSHFKCFQYHSDWNLLMPVVEKIEALKNGHINLNKVWITINGCECSIWTYFDVNEVLRSAGNDGKFRVKCKGASKIEATFLAIIQFIKWHNEQLASINTENIFNEAAAQFPNTLKKLPDAELPEMHILYNPSGHEESDSEERTLDREEMTKTEATMRNALLRSSGSDNRWILDIGKAQV